MSDNNDELEQRRNWRAFLSWWCAPEQQELRYSCAQGWGWKIWQAAIASKQEQSDGETNVSHQR